MTKELKKIADDLGVEASLLVRNYSNFDQIKAGDYVAIEGTSGMCSGGASYGILAKVYTVDDDNVNIEDGSFSREDGQAASPPWCYEILYWISSSNK
jgi:hypothetical protein